MSFSPVVPFAGLAGWAFLKRTRETQEAAFAGGSAIQRDEAYFREKIAEVKSADDLVSDRRLLSVALDAYGLGDDINNRFFIRKVLEDGTLDSDALANRMADKRYLEFSKAFGFGDYAIPRTQLSDFADKLLGRYETQKFEAAVGEQNEEMRLALYAERELATLANKTLSDDGKWLTVMGSAPLRQIFETAFGLPDSFASIDLDQQLTVFRDKAEQFLGSGSASQFSEPESIEKLVRLYLARAQIETGASGTAGQSAALTILQSGGSSAGILSLLG